MLTCGKNLRKIRESLSLKTIEFSALLKVHYRTYLSYERDERAIPNELIKDLIQQFNINANFIFTGNGEIYNTKPFKPEQTKPRRHKIECMKLDCGDRLYLIQKYNGLSDEQMADLMGISVSRYFELTNDSKEPSLKEYDAIKANFDVSIDDVRYDENGLFTRLEQEMKKAKDTYDSLTPKEKEAFKKFLKKHNSI